ncbi:MAG TPA: PilW family protein [Burkholderiales bacterium]|nr:PilW family protein [Burkholderiales bacterium]
MRVHLTMSMRGALPMGRVQSGFSLVELMVSLTIGLIVSLAVMMGYLGAAQAQRGQTDITRIQETARFAFDLYGRETRNAAFRNNTVAASGGAQSFGTNTGTNTFLAGTNDGTSSTTLPDTSTVAVINSGDVITFRYFGMDSTTAGTADGTILNCTGTGVIYGQLNEDTLYIARDTTNTVFDSNGEPTLYCASRQMTGGAWGATTTIPLIPGVESMQVLYGEDTDSDSIVNHYVPAGSISTADFSLVRSLMVSIAVRSPSASGFTTAAVLNHFGQDYANGTAPSGDAGSIFTSPADGRLRRVYNTTFAVRNVL